MVLGDNHRIVLELILIQTVDVNLQVSLLSAILKRFCLKDRHRNISKNVQDETSVTQVQYYLTYLYVE